MDRRTFLGMAGCVAVSLSAGVLPGCSHRRDDAFFPQGVACGDPTPDSLMLWTRAEPVLPWSTRVAVNLEVSEDPDFSRLLLRRTLHADVDSDFTLRVLLEDLQPDRIYYYRFCSGGSCSRTGRGWTAPARDQATPVTLAFVSCQERRHGYYNAYRRMIEDDRQRPREEQIRFLLHLGDFIYETRNDPLQPPIDDEGGILPDLVDPDGRPRRLPPFPDGGRTENGIEFARSLDDYRQLYKEYLSDPDLQAARARWPFVTVWDDHEFSDDCWQTEANYHDRGRNSSTDEPSQPRKLAANQAWFEYMPARLEHDFIPAEVGTTPNRLINEDNLAANADNLKALASLTIHRELHFGHLLQLLLTDSRSYRSDHAIPEDLSGNIDLFLSPRMGLPLELQNQLDAGREDNNGNPDSLLYLGSVVLNPRQYSPPGSLLGRHQKDWFMQRLIERDARWTLWGNPVPLMRFLIDLSTVSDLPDLVLSSDSWDGYNHERKELMNFLEDNDLRNVISLSGDFHAHYAGLVLDDHDRESPRPVMAEAVCAAISSTSQFDALERLTRREQPTATEALIRSLVEWRDPDTDRRIENFNLCMLRGCRAAATAAAGGDRDAILAAGSERTNRHLDYADTRAHGYGLCRVEAERVRIELVTLEGITSLGETGVKRRARFEIPWTAAGAAPEIRGKGIEGEAPYPVDLGLDEPE